MELGLKDKVYIVTGGSKGIGEGIVLELIKEGAIPVIVGRPSEATTKQAAMFEEAGHQFLSIEMNLGVEDNCKTIVDQTMDAFGKIDGIVNNAGVNDGVSLINGNPAAFMKSVQTNLAHYYDLVHYAIEPLKITRGSVVNISSKVAVTGQGGTSGYAASKGAQIALTREWAAELAPYNIRVNAILPAEVMTPLYSSWLRTFENPKEKLEKIVSNIPLENRMTTSEEIAAMAVFLLSERSAHTTGQWLFVDGGYVHLDRSIT